MGLFNQYPYTDFHQLNIQWVLEICKRMEQTMNALEDTINSIIDSRVEDIRKDLTALIDEFRTQVNKQLADNVQQMNELRTYVDTNIANMQKQLDAQVEEIERLFAEQDKEVDQKLADIRAELEEQKQYVEQKLKDTTDALNEQMNTLDDDLRTLIRETIDQFNQDFDAYRKDVNQRITYLHQYIDATSNADRAYTDAEIQYVLSLIDKIVLDKITYVTDPTTEKVVLIQEALDNMFYNLKCWALTAEDHDRVGITAGQFDGIDETYYYPHNPVTAYDDDYLSKWYFKEEPEIYRKVYVRSPYTGSFENVGDIVIQLFDVMDKQHSITAGEFDALELDAETFDNKQLSAYQFDWDGRSFLMPVA